MTITINGSGTITGVTTLGTTLTSPTLTTPIVTTTIGVGNATPAASGAGISFPATQSASTDANTLDDYEEGTWTPVLIGLTTSGTGTYTAQAGAYTKIGRMVTLSGTLIWTAHTGTGFMAIQGLPFNVANINNALEYMSVPEFFNMTMPASTTPMVLITNNSTQVNVYSQSSGALNGLTMDTSANIYFTITYPST